MGIITLDLPDEQHERLRKLAAVYGIRPGSLVKVAVQVFLENERRDKQ